MKVITDTNKLIQLLCLKVRYKRHAIDVDCIKAMMGRLRVSPIDIATDCDPVDAYVERAVAALEIYPETAQCGWAIEGMPVEVWLVATYGRAKELVAACIIADLLHRAGLTDGFTAKHGEYSIQLKSTKTARRLLGFKFSVRLGSEVKPLRMPKGALWHIETDDQLYRWLCFKLLSELPRVPIQVEVIDALRLHICTGYIEGGISGPWILDDEGFHWLEDVEDPTEGCRVIPAYAGLFDIYRRLEVTYRSVKEGEAFTAGDVFTVLGHTKTGRYFSFTVQDTVVWLRGRKLLREELQVNINMLITPDAHYLAP